MNTDARTLPRIRIAGVLLLFSALIFAGRRYIERRENGASLVFSPYSMITELWSDYKKTYITDEGRTIDPDREDITTSEGQSYTMLRAVWMSDRETFDTAWHWTRNNLKRPDSHLFSWLFGKNDEGDEGVLYDIGGGNSASDADTDIALALIFAYARWNESSYLDEARLVVNDIWKNEVVIAGGVPILVANNIEHLSKEKVLVNPSYFAPYAYRVFAKLDPEHPWEELVASSYAIIRRNTLASLDQPASARIPSDWLLLDRETGALLPSYSGTLTTSYGYEAARIPWRLALDWQWFEDARAKDTLELFSFLRSQWETGKTLYAIYSHNGDVAASYETPMMYGGSLGYFLVIQPGLGRDIYEQKLQSLYSADKRTWKKNLGYYDANWAWFGIGLYHGFLTNLSPFPVRITEALSSRS